MGLKTRHRNACTNGYIDVMSLKNYSVLYEKFGKLKPMPLARRKLWA